MSERGKQMVAPPTMKPVGFRKPSDVVGDEVITQLGEAGWEVVRKSTEKKRQLRTATAEMRAYWAEVDRDSAQRWGQSLSQENRRLMDRISFLYHEAIARGATIEELQQP